MGYLSIDTLQKALAKNVFAGAADSKKAAGRALGTFVELITYYLLCAWRLREHIAIERPVAEYANREITHNVEFTLHTSSRFRHIDLTQSKRPLTAGKLCKLIPGGFPDGTSEKGSQPFLTTDGCLKNACTIATSSNSFFNAYIDANGRECAVYELANQPLALFECKRVGVEEGARKGPQTIEKAKQGAYVAKTVSSLQKIRARDGSLIGIYENDDGAFTTEPYYELLEKLIFGKIPRPQNFMLTVGVVSNHGNWFTKERRNKELEVLAESYDWLLFLSDDGLATFIDRLMSGKDKKWKGVSRAFYDSYGVQKKGKNCFTKSFITEDADRELREFFEANIAEVEGWFNLISPMHGTIDDLKSALRRLVGGGCQ